MECARAIRVLGGESCPKSHNINALRTLFPLKNSMNRQPITFQSLANYRVFRAVPNSHFNSFIVTKLRNADSLSPLLPQTCAIKGGEGGALQCLAPAGRRRGRYQCLKASARRFPVSPPVGGHESPFFGNFSPVPAESPPEARIPASNDLG